MSRELHRRVITAAISTDAAHQAGWDRERSDDIWVNVSHPGAVVPTQGWKLHVSATVNNAADVMERSLPVLMAEPTSFKVAASLEQLADLNRGDGGPSQVGKFITVYPVDDAQAVRLAAALDRATDGLVGPRIPSDRPLRPGGVVHYRYGGFAERWMQTALGEVVGAIESPDGNVEADWRTRWYRAPAWAEDPFVAAGLVTNRPPIDLLVADRYLTAAVLGSSPEVTVRLVVDLEGGERRVLKEARRGDEMTTQGAQGRLRHEADVLARLGDDPHIPSVHDLFEVGSSLFLVMDHIAGLTLEQRVRALAADGRFLSSAQVARWATTLTEILGRLHLRGMFYGDLKPPNVVIGSDDELFLVDMESVSPGPVDADSAILGTPGYVSPQRSQRLAASVSDDVHCLGAVLYFMVTAADPSLAPSRFRVLDRSPELFNPAVPASVVDLIRRCLEPSPDARPASMAELRELLVTAFEESPSAPVPVGAPPPLELAREVAGRVCRWRPSAGEGPARRNIDGGVAGVVLALAQAAPELDDEDVWRKLRTQAGWLASSAPLLGGPLPGLYVGEAGIGLALLRAGQALGDGALMAASIEKGRMIAALPHRSPDLFNGTAGRLRFHLALWQATTEDEHLDAAVAAGAHLVASVERPEPGQAEWRIPAGYDRASGMAYLGYAHGSAGIADALLDLYQTTGDDILRDLAVAVFRRLDALAVPVLEDGSGRDWPDAAGGDRAGGLWCHGAAGIARFLSHVVRLDLVPDARGLCAAAGLAVSATRSGLPGQCHGLAGNADVLVDVYLATGDSAHLESAHSLARLLPAFLAEPDALVPLSPGFVRSADLMNGWAGVLTCLLRLSAPDRLPHLLAL